MGLGFSFRLPSYSTKPLAVTLGATRQQRVLRSGIQPYTTRLRSCFFIFSDKNYFAQLKYDAPTYNKALYVGLPDL